MAKNNVHVLTDEELATGKAYYVFEVKSDLLVFKPVGFNRSTVKPIDQPFNVIYKCNGQSVRVSISPLAIKMWHEKFNKFHLLEVQNAINKLTVIYQDIDEDDLRNILNDPNYIKIKKVI